jgi:hypothetical protein
MLRRSSNFVRSTVNYRSLAPSQLVHQYATSAPQTQQEGRVSLREDLKKYLKPDVLKVIESKTDTVLIKKLNFLGRNFVCRLNVANKLILNSLSQDNVFRLLVKELQDPWTYYWQHIRKNGKDPQKWLESLKEVTHLPPVIDRCFREMTLSGVYPSTEHFNVYLMAMTEWSDNRSFHMFHDELNRANQQYRPDAESYLAMALLWAKQGNYFLANQTYQYMKNKGWATTQELDSLMAQLKSTYDPVAAAAYYHGKGDKPQFIKEKERLYAQNQSKIVKSAEASLQPPLEKLVVVEDQ